ncbi:hypothetical protein AGMMS49525_04510 [Bacteroidia bacterium]|nr:hypothetical protein AGMMS49525_04510 [Bacteroidia bacterium]
MYDNIKISLTVPFVTSYRADFCARFGLLVKDEKKQIYSNKGYETLTQNKGVYMHLKNSKLTLEFSLHKFYNYCVYEKPFNYNDFTFKEAQTAAAWLVEMFNRYFDIAAAKVVKYEVGINVITSENPDLYLQELKQINVNAKVLPIKEDTHYKEYKQFSTQRDKDKRIIYIFYNKTFEARSKGKAATRANIPENVLRVEKDNKRPFEKIVFARLFDIDFMKLTVNEFKQRFCSDLEYKGIPVKLENMKRFEFDLLRLIYEKGTDGAKARIKADFENGTIKRACYFNKLRVIERISATTPEIQIQYSRRAIELNNLIISKIETVHKNGLF